MTLPESPQLRVLLQPFSRISLRHIAWSTTTATTGSPAIRTMAASS